MKRFFVESPIQTKEVLLQGEEVHHLLHVFRASVGMEVTLFDPTGTQYLAKVLDLGKKKAKLQILSEQKVQKLNGGLILAQALIKKKGWDLLLQRSMELGLINLIPVITQHLGQGIQATGKRERWTKILVSAAKQSGRNDLLKIDPLQKFEEFLENTKNVPLRLLAHNGEKLPSFKNVLKTYAHLEEDTLVLVGPEGGFSQKELDLAQEYGFIFFSLGSNILRAETAAISIIANYNFYWRD